MRDSVVVRAPLKLVLAGEYAVLDPGSPGIVAAIDRYVTCRAEPASEVELVAVGLKTGTLRGPAPGRKGELVLEPGETGAGDFGFAKAALEIGYRYLAELFGERPRPLKITCDSRAGLLERDGGPPVKLGLGTSAASTVSMLGALLLAHGVPIDRATFARAGFRLALLAHEDAQGGLGSGIDVAGSAVGGLVEYTRPDPRLRRRLPGRESPLAAVRGPWPGLHVEALPVPLGMRLLVGFTGKSAATTDLVRAVERWRRDRPNDYEPFARRTRRAVQALGQALRHGHAPGVLAAIHTARETLAFLGERAHVAIETPELERLIEVANAADAEAKPSGAGGGDCGIAIAFDAKTAERVVAGWRDAGICPVPVEIARYGLHERAEKAAAS